MVVIEKSQWPYRKSNPRPPDLQRIASTNCVPNTDSKLAAVERIARAERDGIRAETRFRLSPKRTSPFKSVGVSVQSTAVTRGVHISFSNAGYTMFGGGVRVLATNSLRQFPLHFPSRASPCTIRLRTSSTSSLFGPNVLLSTLFSNTLSPRSSLNVSNIVTTIFTVVTNLPLFFPSCRLHFAVQNILSQSAVTPYHDLSKRRGAT